MDFLASAGVALAYDGVGGWGYGFCRGGGRWAQVPIKHI